MDMSKTNGLDANAVLAAPRTLLRSYLEEAAEKLANRRRIVGERIREAREAKGWLQKELARRLHVEPQTVSNWERGASTPDLDKIELLAAELEQPVVYFFADASLAAVPDINGSELASLREELAVVRGEMAGLAREVRGAIQLLRQHAAAHPEDDQSGT